MDKYPNLDGLLQQSAGALAYWNNLPDYVQEQIGTRSDNVRSLESLKDYAENLLRGDN